MSKEHVMALSPGERILTVKKISILAFLTCTAIVAQIEICWDQLNFLQDISMKFVKNS